MGRSLILRILAYYQQAQRFGDLDQISRQTLAETAAAFRARSDIGRPGGPDAGTTAEAKRLAVATAPIIRPGTLLVREHEGTSHRVMVLEEGFAWNGKTYDSLSKVAFAITGTRWNGPRFFGLWDKKAAGAGGRKGSEANALASSMSGSIKRPSRDRITAP